MTTLRPPGDKSISHRALMIAAVADGEVGVRGLSPCDDVAATARALRQVGVAVPEGVGADFRIPRPDGLIDADQPLDCGNSGTSARLLLGLLAGAGVGATFDGDRSLRGRPMDRVAYPLQAMGVRLEYLGAPSRLPIRLAPRASGALRRLVHRPRVASAQVKSAILLAGLASGAEVEVREPGPSRDHTERLFAALGIPIETESLADGSVRIRLPAGARSSASGSLDIEVPADPSGAAFLLGAAALAGAPVSIEGVSLNPTRTGFLDVLDRFGVEVGASGTRTSAGEPLGRLHADAGGALEAVEIAGSIVPRLIDEIPLLCVLAARARGTTRIRDAAELRVKESDRIALLASNLTRLGVRCVEQPDGLDVEGSGERLKGRVVTDGDHRIAMAFGALGKDPACEIEIDDPACVSVSYPGFWEDLDQIG